MKIYDVSDISIYTEYTREPHTVVVSFAYPKILFFENNSKKSFIADFLEGKHYPIDFLPSKASILNNPYFRPAAEMNSKFVRSTFWTNFTVGNSRGPKPTLFFLRKWRIFESTRVSKNQELDFTQ